MKLSTRVRTAALLLGLFGTWPVALAAPRALATATSLSMTPDPDQNQPTQIDADKWHYDNKSQKSLFTGNVRLTKGSLIMSSDQLLSQQNKDNQVYGVATAQKDHWVTFVKKRANLEEWVKGRAQEIIYDSVNHNLTLKGVALLRRVDKNDVLRDQITGAVIVYDTQTDGMKVYGKAASIAGNGDGRVHVILMPTEASTAGDASGQKSSEKSDKASGKREEKNTAVELESVLLPNSLLKQSSDASSKSTP